MLSSARTRVAIYTREFESSLSSNCFLTIFALLLYENYDFHVIVVRYIFRVRIPLRNAIKLSNNAGRINK